jgi:hypothetical protein
LSFQKDKKYEFINHILLTISNICLKDSLKPQILYNKGVEVLLAHLRNDSNIEGQRVAAKGLLNLSISSRDTKIKIVGEITEEIRKFHRNELDSIVAGYI